MGWLFLIAAIALAACILLIKRMQADQQQQKKMRERMRSSRMYAGLGLMLMQTPKEYVERVDIRPEGVTVLLLGGQQLRYLFEEHNSDNVKPDSMVILAAAVATDLDVVQDTEYFKLHRHTETTPDGKPVTCYTYILHPQRKNYLLRLMKEKGSL